jgi:signal recognition particle GTPase
LLRCLADPMRKLDPDFTLDHFMAQVDQVRRLGPTGRLMGLIPGMGEMMAQVKMTEGDIENSLRQMRAMYDSMTPVERARPGAIDAGRRRRIARGAGCGAVDVAKFIADFEQSREMMRAVGRMGVLGKPNVRRPWADKTVLGLASWRRRERDPSFVYSERRERQQRRMWELLVLSMAGAGVTVWLFWRLLR